jgi:signal transduction histidine kinase/FixJ family two-component response regulator/HPt (histidine-containing phosphotransfer) domain-containing protein
VLGTLAVFVSVFLYNELKEEFKPQTENPEAEKIVETGTLINSLYETDSYANLAILTLKEEDFETYVLKNDSLFTAIDTLKTRISKSFQLQQLDSVKILLAEKKLNIEQLRLLKITNNNDTSLDDILEEFKNLETNMGVVTIENFVESPRSLSRDKRRKLQNYIDYLNARRANDSPTVKTEVIDSMLAATRYIVSGAKRSSQRLRKSLLEQESELIDNDLNISEQLRRVIFDFDAEIVRNQELDNIQKRASVARSSQVLRIAAITGAIVILLFSYWLITDFFRAEKLKNKLQKEKQTTDALLRSREQLIATVSHDLKTPLSTIAGYTELFKNTNLTEKQSHYTDHISASTTYITKLADDLLDLSKLEAGKIRLEKVPFSLTTLIKQVAESNAALHSEKPVVLHLNFEPELESLLFESDPIRIQQIVNNLISNAFKFTHEGSVTVTVSKSNSYKTTPTISIAVTDTGIGIGEEKQGLIFKEFTQAEVDTAQKFGGSGLGLTISKKLAKLLDGKLKLKSEIGAGSNFTFSVPLQISKHKPKNIEKEVSLRAKLKAIILDDDEALLSMLSELCSQLHIEIRTFTNFSKVLKEQNLPFDFLLTDMQMPDYSGLDVLTELQAGKLASYNGQPVILMTGDGSFSENYYTSKGFASMLRKPFSSAVLKDVLASLFPSEVIIEEKKELAETSPANANQDFDLSLLASFLGSQEAMKEVLDVFVLQSEQNMSAIKKAIQTEDFKTMGNTAHKMLTMCRQIQAKKVTPILEKMERYISEKLSLAEIRGEEKKLIIAMKSLITKVKAI